MIIDGTDLSALDDNTLSRLRREKIGFIFQFFNLLPALTAQENVALPLHLARIRRNEIAARSARLLKTVGLEDRFDHLPDELSGGEQQRVAMAPIGSPLRFNASAPSVRHITFPNASSAGSRF